MKFKDNVSEVQQIGDIKRNSVSIDTENIDFIVTILSTNLYSNPIQSFIRETVSNAWDAHIEAQNDSPVLLEINEDTEGNTYCKIQDFGIGLSPERFDKIYRNIGSSTKRGGNDQIGGFGIGRFSALAVSNNVYITTNYDGIKYKYLMYKDGNSVNIDEIFQQPTDEKNGTEILVYIDSYKVYQYEDAIYEQLLYFDNLYVLSSNKDLEEKFNKAKIRRFKHFSVSTLQKKAVQLLVGKVPYPVRLNQKFTSQFMNAPISVHFDIGDLEVTPNREEILYTEKNIEIIEAKMLLAEAELKDFVDKNTTKDFDDIEEYYQALEETNYLYLIGDKDSDIYARMTVSQRNFTLAGVAYHNGSFRNCYHNILHLSFFKIHNSVSSRRISKEHFSVSPSWIRKNFHKVFVGNLSKVSNITKEYIRDLQEEKGSTIYFMKDIHMNFSELKIFYRDIRRSTGASFDLKSVKIILKYIYYNLSFLQKIDDKAPTKKWRKEREEKMKEKRKNRQTSTIDWSEEVNLYKIRRGYKGYNTLAADTEVLKLGDLYKKFKKLTVYVKKDKIEDLKNLYFLADYHINFVAIAPTKMKLLKDVENFVHLKDLYNVKYSIIRNIGTAEWLLREFPELDSVSKIEEIREVSEKLYNLLTKFQKFVDTWGRNDRTYINDRKQIEGRQQFYEICNEHNYFNEEIRGEFNANRKMLEHAKLFLLFSDKKGNYYSSEHIPEKRLNVLTDYILARKLFRPDLKAVNRKNKETIYNIKTEKDEDN